MMMSDDEEQVIASGPPHTFGWLRRPELDARGQFAWEMPDGGIYLTTTDPKKTNLQRVRRK